MKKRLLSAILCVSMVASLIVGCGSKSSSEEAAKFLKSYILFNRNNPIALSLIPSGGKYIGL